MHSHGPLFIGLDGGGTKTVAVVIDRDANVVGRALGGCTNWHSVSEEEASQVLKDTLQGAVNQCKGGWQEVKAMCLAMSGVDTERDRLRVDLAVHNDAVGTLACGTHGRPEGCVLIAGTGTIAYGVGKNGKHARAGGWGPLFLDGGSGYDIGQRGLAAAAKAYDGRGPETSLLGELCKHCGVEPWEGLLEWAYKDRTWARVAELAVVVIRCAEAGDTVAWDIVSAAAAEAVRSVAAVASRCSFTHDFDLVLAGGLLLGDSGYADIVREHLRLSLPHARILVPNMEAAVGAALLAKAQVSQAHDQ
eukprot:jgi/Botrbrau1/9243/Bobra.180_1s0005.2